MSIGGDIQIEFAEKRRDVWVKLLKECKTMAEVKIVIDIIEKTVI